MAGRIADEQFVSELTRCQGPLMGYLTSVTGDVDAAAEVLQETNLTLWRSFDRYTPGTPFMAWACRVAYFEVLTWRRSQKRDRLRFDESLLEQVAANLERQPEQLIDRHAALQRCLEKLPGEQRRIIELRYRGDTPVDAIANTVGRPVKTVYQMLYRIRLALVRCVEESVA
jgi:RNA polymerase sigma-70 factor (ECF subfamily)